MLRTPACWPRQRRSKSSRARKSRGRPGDLANTVIDVHSKIAAGTGVAVAVVASVDRRRYEVIDLFKADPGLKASRSADTGPASGAQT